MQRTSLANGLLIHSLYILWYFFNSLLLFSHKANSSEVTSLLRAEARCNAPLANCERDGYNWSSTSHTSWWPWINEAERPLKVVWWEEQGALPPATWSGLKCHFCLRHVYWSNVIPRVLTALFVVWPLQEVEEVVLIRRQEMQPTWWSCW